MRVRSSRLSLETDGAEYSYSRAGRVTCVNFERARATLTDTSLQDFNKRTGGGAGERGSGGNDHAGTNAG